ncbi:MAG TPA: hypothetical protein VKB51_11475, partial [bacterium]|nr:hypothetical protein [bacterium]
MRKAQAWMWMVLLAMTVGLTACGGGGGSSSGGSSAPTGTNYVFDDGSGSTSTVTLYADSYVNNKSNGYQETGSVTHLSDGFLKIVKQTTTDPGDTSPLPHTYYGLEIPDTALFVVDPSGNSVSNPPGTPGEYVSNMVGVNQEGQCPAPGTELLAMAA